MTKSSQASLTAEGEKTDAGAMHHVPQATNNTMVLKVPKPNMQVVVLGLVALITLFQTFQLVRISSNVTTVPVKAAPAAATTNTDVPQSMVGGC